MDTRAVAARGCGVDTVAIFHVCHAGGQPSAQRHGESTTLNVQNNIELRLFELLQDMTSKWDKWSRAGLDVASTATMLGFSAAKVGTKLGVRSPSRSNFIRST